MGRIHRGRGERGTRGRAEPKETVRDGRQVLGGNAAIGESRRTHLLVTQGATHGWSLWALGDGGSPGTLCGHLPASFKLLGAPRTQTCWPQARGGRQQGSGCMKIPRLASLDFHSAPPPHPTPPPKDHSASQQGRSVIFQRPGNSSRWGSGQVMGAERLPGRRPPQGYGQRERRARK